MQVTRKHVIAIALILVLAIPSLALRKSYEGCESYTQALNGGTKEFDGEKYKIEMWGASLFGDGDEIRLQVMGPAGMCWRSGILWCARSTMQHPGNWNTRTTTFSTTTSRSRLRCASLPCRLPGRTGGRHAYRCCNDSSRSFHKSWRSARTSRLSRAWYFAASRRIRASSGDT